jgi:hypothetical protein
MKVRQGLIVLAVLTALSGCTATQRIAGGAKALANCDYPQWVEYRPYYAGAIVQFKEKYYIATHENPGYIPTVSTYYWHPHNCAK